MESLAKLFELAAKYAWAAFATTALLLIFIRNAIRLLGQLMPDGQFELLAHPSVTPPFLVSFMKSHVASITQIATTGDY